MSNLGIWFRRGVSRIWAPILVVSRLVWHAWPMGAFLLPIIMIVLALAEGPGVALGIRWVVDELVVTKSFSLGGSLLVVVSIGLSALLRGVSEKIQAILDHRGARAIALEVLNSSLRPGGIEHLESPKYANRVQVVRSGAPELASGVFLNASVLLAQAVAVGTSIAIVMNISWMLGPLFAFQFPALVFHLRSADKSAMLRERASIYHRWAERLRSIAMSVEAGKEARIFGSEGYLIDEYSRLSRDYEKWLLKSEFAHLPPAIVGGLLQGVALGLGLWVLLWLRINGEISIGEVALGLAVLQGMIAGAKSIRIKAGGILDMSALAERLVWLRDYDSPVANSSNPVAVPTRLDGGVSFEDVSFIYPGTHRFALKGVTMRIEPGINAIVGENGSGKSTLIKLLCRFYDPTEGRILVDGVDLRELDLDTWRSKLRFVFQDYCHFEFKLREAIGIGNLELISDQTTIDNAAKQAGLRMTTSADLNEALETTLGPTFPGGVDLSEGEWQRVALARSYMREAALLSIMDEPSARLDPSREVELFAQNIAASSAMREVGGIGIIASHKLAACTSADNIVVLSGGAVQQVGTHEQLLNQRGTYRELFNLQSSMFRDDG